MSTAACDYRLHARDKREGVASPHPGWETLGPACWARDGVKRLVGMQARED